MSHLRDLQRLRSTKNSFHIKERIIGGDLKLSEVRTTRKSGKKDGLGKVSLSRKLEGEIHTKKYSNFLQLKEYEEKQQAKEPYSQAITHEQIKHKQGVTFEYDKLKAREIEMGSGLSIYNLSCKFGDTQIGSESAKATRKNSENNPKKDKNYEFSNVESPIFKSKEGKSKKDHRIRIKVEQNYMQGKNCFEVMYPVGKGGFGKVWKVSCKKTGEIFAMKEMQKAKIINKKSVNSVMNERTLLADLEHPFLVNIKSSFQDRENLYLVMDYLNGGDLRYHIGCRGTFGQSETKFFVACIIIALEYLHEHKVIHRDIKPENFVFDSDGYLRLTDLGVSRIAREDNHKDTSGTPGYMAPEVICHQNHSFTADYFALGVMCYEFMFGKRPYNGNSRKEIRENILAKQVEVKFNELPYKWSLKAVDFVNQLLQRNPSKRLGTNGIDELKEHPWLADIDWRLIKAKAFKSPFIPIIIEENYEDYKQQISEDTLDDQIEETQMLLRDAEVQLLFKGYEFSEKDIRGSGSMRKSLGASTNNTDSEMQSLRNSWR